MNDPAINPIVRQTAQFLVDVLCDEVPLADPTTMKQHFMIWLTGFRYMNAGQATRPNGHYLLRRARQEANRYYKGHIQQSFHNWQDKAYMLGTLSNALLKACGCFEEPISETDPRDLLRAESLHNGHYACLYMAVTNMFFGQGIPDRSYLGGNLFSPLSAPQICPN